MNESNSINMGGKREIGSVYRGVPSTSVKVVDLGRQSEVLIVNQSQSFNFSPGSDALVELEKKQNNSKETY